MTVLRLALPMLVGVAASVAGQSAPPRTPPHASIALSLATLVTTALRNNLDLRAAELGPRFAASNLMAARGGFDPSLTIATSRGNSAYDPFPPSARSTQTSAVSTATLGTVLPFGSSLAFGLRNSTVSLDPFASSLTQPFPNTHASSLSVSVTQPLLRGFGRSGTYGLVDAAVASMDAARNRYDRSADVTVAQVEHAYWVLRQAETNEDILRQSVDASRAIYERNVALQARDVATTLDVLTSERGFATRETQLWEATRQRIDAADRLLFLVYGEDARDATLLQAALVHTSGDTASTAVIPAVADAERIALAQRADALAAVREVDAAGRRVAQTRSQRLPRLDLIASYGYGGSAPGSGLLSVGDSLRSSSWNLGFSTSLFQRNDAARAVDERAASALELSRMTRLATDNAVRGEVRAAVRALQTGHDRFLRAGEVGQLAEREYAAAREGARLGLITTFQLLQYEEQLAQARLLVAQTRFALEDAGTQYRLAIGDGRRAYGGARPEH